MSVRKTPAEPTPRIKRSDHTSKRPPPPSQLQSPPAARPPARQPPPPPRLTQMPPPPGSSAPAPERRLAVLLSHFRPCREAPRAATRLATAERHGTAAAAEAEAVLSASPCAAGGSGSSGGEYCVFCNIIAGAAPAFKVCFPDSFSRSACNRVATRGALCLSWLSQPVRGVAVLNLLSWWVRACVRCW
jgi:hypothetical protein